MDNNEIEFNSLKELFERLTPALKSKQDELHRLGFTYIKLESIWDYLKDNKWKNASGLLLYQMVDDIVNLDPLIIDSYVKEELLAKE